MKLTTTPLLKFVPTLAQKLVLVGLSLSLTMACCGPVAALARTGATTDRRISASEQRRALKEIDRRRVILKRYLDQQSRRARDLLIKRSPRSSAQTINELGSAR